ncbi:MAG TPA: tetratricopeptide repeat protein [Gemmatimonadales bacterium]
MIALSLALQLACSRPADPTRVTPQMRLALEAACRQEIAANPHDLKAYDILAEALIGSPPERLKVLQAGLQVAPDNFSFQLNAGYCLRELGRFDEALTALKRAATLDTTMEGGLALSQAGLVAQTMRKNVDALELFRRSLSRAPQDGSTWGYMARSLYALHKYPDAVQAWDRAESLSAHGYIDEAGDRSMYQRSRALSSRR